MLEASKGGFSVRVRGAGDAGGMSVAGLRRSRPVADGGERTLRLATDDGSRGRGRGMDT